MKTTALAIFALTAGCAHYQGREIVHGVADARWCQRQAVTYSLGEGLSDAEQSAIVTSAADWNAAAASLPAPMVKVTLLTSATGRGDIEISRSGGGDWGTKLAVAPDGCIVRAHIEAGAELDPQVLSRETRHALGLAAESVWPGDVMYNGAEITRDDAMVATQRFQATTNDR